MENVRVAVEPEVVALMPIPLDVPLNLAVAVGLETRRLFAMISREDEPPPPPDPQSPHVPSPFQHVEEDAPVPLFKFATGRFPVTSFDDARLICPVDNLFVASVFTGRDAEIPVTVMLSVVIPDATSKPPVTVNEEETVFFPEMV